MSILDDSCGMLSLKMCVRSMRMCVCVLRASTSTLESKVSRRPRKNRAMTEITAMPHDRYRLITVFDNVSEMEETFKLHDVFAYLPHVESILHFRRSCSL